MSREELWAVKGGTETRRNRAPRTGNATASPPNAPSTFTVGTITTNSVALSWSTATVPSGAAPVTAYRIYDAGGTLRASTGVANSVTVTGLTAATTYTFTVVAVNSTGESPDSVARTFKTTSAVVTTSSFVADPGAGKYYVGWADGPSSGGIARGSVTQARVWTPNPPDISVYHTYGGSGAMDASLMQKSKSAGCIASHTFHGSPDNADGSAGSYADLANGLKDAQIDADAAACAALAPWPIWACMLHEPEDNITTATEQANYRKATRRYVTRFRAAGVTNVSWMPILMAPYSFSSKYGGNRDWRLWHADWDPVAGWNDTLTMDMMGLDFYLPLIGATTYHTFAQMMDDTRAATEAAGVPQWDYVFPEFGMSYHVSPRPNWNTWLTAGRDYAIAHGIKSFCYWDNSTDVSRYSFDSVGDPDGTKLQGWRTLCASARSYP